MHLFHDRIETVAKSCHSVVHRMSQRGNKYKGALLATVPCVVAYLIGFTRHARNKASPTPPLPPLPGYLRLALLSKVNGEL